VAQPEQQAPPTKIEELTEQVSQLRRLAYQGSAIAGHTRNMTSSALGTAALLGSAATAPYAAYKGFEKWYDPGTFARKEAKAKTDTTLGTYQGIFDSGSEFVSGLARKASKKVPEKPASSLFWPMIPSLEDFYDTDTLLGAQPKEKEGTPSGGWFRDIFSYPNAVNKNATFDTPELQVSPQVLDVAYKKKVKPTIGIEQRKNTPGEMDYAPVNRNTGPRIVGRVYNDMQYAFWSGMDMIPTF
jgi:hypothetical protein